MILSTKRSVVIADVFCDEPFRPEGADVVRYNHWSTSISGFVYSPFYTVVLDLTQPEDDLFNRIDQPTRYKIRRANKDELAFEVIGRERSAETLEQFCDFYDQFAATRALPPVERPWLRSLAASGSLVLTVVRRHGAPLIWHAYAKCATVALQLYSTPLVPPDSDPALRQIIGRASRYQHWEDVVYFRNQGMATLDLGGWYGGSDDQKLLAINRFKAEFGGDVIAVHNGMAPVSWKGRLAIAFLHARARRRGVAQSA